MKRILEWFKASNRWKHLTYAIPVGFIDLGMAIGVASGMEFKINSMEVNGTGLIGH